jgi:uncharacterized membrane protein (DUF485 family)
MNLCYFILAVYIYLFTLITFNTYYIRFALSSSMSTWETLLGEYEREAQVSD